LLVQIEYFVSAALKEQTKNCTSDNKNKKNINTESEHCPVIA
jgi:hypothetical protein